MQLQQGFASREIGLWLTLQDNKLDTADVRNGSLASFPALWLDVRYSPKSDRDCDWPAGRNVPIPQLTSRAFISNGGEQGPHCVRRLEVMNALRCSHVGDELPILRRHVPMAERYYFVA